MVLQTFGCRNKKKNTFSTYGELSKNYESEFKSVPPTKNATDPLSSSDSV